MDTISETLQPSLLRFNKLNSKLLLTLLHAAFVTFVGHQCPIQYTVVTDSVLTLPGKLDSGFILQSNLWDTGDPQTVVLQSPMLYL